MDNEIIAQAKKEIQEEEFRFKVEAYKQKLREKRTLWERIFPWKILVVRRSDVRRERSKETG